MKSVQRMFSPGACLPHRPQSEAEREGKCNVCTQIEHEPKSFTAKTEKNAKFLEVFLLIFA